MSEVLEKKWYVVRAVSGQENKIKGYIESEVSRLGFSDYLEDILVPTEKVVQIRNGKKINKERVYFPMLGKVDELAVNTDSVAIPFVFGETVKVIDGPFNGFNGTVEKINEEKRKLEVMVKIFGRKTPLELSYMQVEKI